MLTGLLAGIFWIFLSLASVLATAFLILTGMWRKHRVLLAVVVVAGLPPLALWAWILVSIVILKRPL